MANKRALAKFLGEVAQWKWDDFVRAEEDMTYSTTESIIFALIRACANENLNAIKTSFNRLDGKVLTPVQIIMPKVYYIFPNAKKALQLEVVEDDTDTNAGAKNGTVVLNPKELAPVTGSPTKGFRDTMELMADHARDTPKKIIEAAEQVEKHLKNQGRAPRQIPRVQSVVAAHVLKMAQDLNLDAINEVFDQLDGKLVETIKVVGEDMYIVNYSEVAPVGARLNDDGVYQIEAPQAEKLWQSKLGTTVEAFIEK